MRKVGAKGATWAKVQQDDFSVCSKEIHTEEFAKIVAFKNYSVKLEKRAKWAKMPIFNNIDNTNGI
jgi:hypothetical protein